MLNSQKIQWILAFQNFARDSPVNWKRTLQFKADETSDFVHKMCTLKLVLNIRKILEVRPLSGDYPSTLQVEKCRGQPVREELKGTWFLRTRARISHKLPVNPGTCVVSRYKWESCIHRFPINQQISSVPWILQVVALGTFPSLTTCQVCRCLLNLRVVGICHSFKVSQVNFKRREVNELSAREELNCTWFLRKRDRISRKQSINPHSIRIQD